MKEYRIIWPEKKEDMERWLSFCSYYLSWLERPDKERFDIQKASLATGYSEARIRLLLKRVEKETFTNGLKLTSKGFFIDVNDP